MSHHLNLTFSTAVTLKIRSRSLKPNHFFILSQCYIHANLIKIHPVVHEISCTQESVTLTHTQMGPALHHKQYVPLPFGGGGGGGDIITVCEKNIYLFMICVITDSFYSAMFILIWCNFLTRIKENFNSINSCLTLKAPWKILEQMTIYFLFLIFQRK